MRAPDVIPSAVMGAHRCSVISILSLDFAPLQRIFFFMKLGCSLVVSAALSAFVMLAVTPLSPAFSEPAAARIKLTYQAYAGPFYVLSADAELVLEDGRYRVATVSRTEGFANWFFSWNSRVVSEGARSGADLRPARHKVQSRWKGKDRRVHLRYDGARPVIETLHPEPDGSKRDPVPETMIGDTVDPLTMTAHLMVRMANGGECRGDYRVFDGRRRYDLTISERGGAELEAPGSSVFRGTARSCALAMDRIAGFRKPDDDEDTNKARLKEPLLWMGRPMETAPPVPVRFEAESSFGRFRLHLTRFEMDGQVLALEE